MRDPKSTANKKISELCDERRWLENEKRLRKEEEREIIVENTNHKRS